LLFIADAITNILNYRGLDAGSHHMKEGGKPRVVVLMNYITREAYVNKPPKDDEPKISHSEEDNEENGHNDLEAIDIVRFLDPSNVVAYMFSVFIFDPEIKISDAFADQLDINKYGHPRYKPSPNAVPTAGAAALLPANNIQNNENEEPIPFNGNGIRSHFGRLVAPGAVDDETTQNLEMKSPFRFVRKVDSTPMNRVDISRIAKTNEYVQYFTNNETYIDLMCRTIGRCNDRADYNKILMSLTSPYFRLSLIPPDNKYYHSTIFSLNAAVAYLSELGAEDVFCTQSTWTVEEDGKTNFKHPPLLDSCAKIDMGKFNAQFLADHCLPHCEILDRELLRPKYKRHQTVIGNHDFSFVLQDICAEIGIVTEIDRIDAERDAFVSSDLFNKMHYELQKIEVEINGGRHEKPDGEVHYVERRSKLREQGLKLLECQMDLKNPKLPSGYKSMLSFQMSNKNEKIEPIHMWQNGNVAMTPFSQMRSLEVILNVAIDNTADIGAMMVPKIRRACDSTYTIRQGFLNHKENMRLVAPPSAGKSILLAARYEHMIPGTYVPKSGASAMAIMGPMESERVVEFHQEMNSILVPRSDPHGQELALMLRKLTQISEGIDIYETSIKNPETEERYLRRRVADHTNTIIGAHNPFVRRQSEDGAAQAMNSRIRAHKYGQTKNTFQNKVFGYIFNNGVDALRGAVSKNILREQLIQMAIMDYWAGVSTKYVPYPDISLLNDLAPIALSYLATIKPELFFQLRDLSTLTTRTYNEIVRNAANLVLLTPLNPHFSETGELPPYDRNTVVLEMGKYCYTTLDIVIYILSEMMFEETSANSYDLVRSILSVSGNYSAFGKGPEKNLDSSLVRMMRLREPNLTDAEVEYLDASEYVEFWHEYQEPESELVERAKEVNDDEDVHLWSVTSALTYLDKQPGNYLGIPDKPPADASQRNGRVDREGHTTAYDLQPIDVKGGFEDIFYLNTYINARAPKLIRTKIPNYKTEVYKSQNYINPNYARINGNFNDFSHRSDLNLQPSVVKDLLYELNRKFIIAPYIPLVPCDLVGANAEGQKMRHKIIQNIRYSQEAMKKFNKYKLPVIIQDPYRRCFYILVAYAEINPYDVVTGMIEHISYGATREMRCILGVPDRNDEKYYASVDIKPIPGKSLILASHSSVSPLTKTLLNGIFNETDLNTNDITRKTQFSEEDDIEEHYARQFFDTNFPSEVHMFNTYTPRAIQYRLYDGEKGYYTRHPQHTKDIVYPDDFIAELVPAQKPVDPVPEPHPSPSPEPHPSPSPHTKHTVIPNPSEHSSSSSSSSTTSSKRKSPETRVRQSRIRKKRPSILASSLAIGGMFHQIRDGTPYNNH